ncbi:MAG: type II secretion system minor pseudopilin GspK [Deltaproteobacteria bacterium]|nr:type II secretion system minor pseudopilin GspK [Deltaproteobacteria bacterium]MBW2019200.1 type II secretion system minor pseudopilin GspK [Deltaproteobacteria bacterium]MBW2074003.1 type II secretion system minor pseudopilin GspK [Deltaproteobacteria bacterium]
MVRFCRNSSGMALILTILIISLIVALTLQFNMFMRSELHAAANFQDGTKLGCIAKSGFNYALAVLLEDALEGHIDTLREAWADPKTLSEKSTALFEEGSFQVKVSDHSGRIQINCLVDQNGKYDAVQKSLLTRFLNSPEFDLDPEEVDNIVDAIKDWIDADSETTGFGGAENTYYHALERPYSCKNAPIAFLEELLLVKGITQELFYGTEEKPGISDYLSPHGDGKININTADPLVLRALSDEINEDMAQDMVAYREDDERDLSDPKWYKKVPGMSHVTIADDLLATSSTYFEITSEGFKGAMAKQVTGVVHRAGQDIRILSWKTE